MPGGSTQDAGIAWSDDGGNVVDGHNEPPVCGDGGASSGLGPCATWGARDASRPDTSTPDSKGSPLAPYPPETCSDASWVASVPRHETVQACGGQLELSSAVTLGGSATPHFFRCGAMGPEVERDLRLAPDGSRLATLTAAGTLRLFATDDWHEIGQLAPPSGRVDAFDFSPDGTHLATLSMERGELVVWNAADGTPFKTFTGPPTAGGVPSTKAALAFSRDGRRIASSLGSIVDLVGRTVAPLGTGAGLGGFVDQMAFTMCDTMLYVRLGFRTGDSNWTTEVSLYDAKSGQPRTLFSEWDVVFGGSAISQDGRLVAVSNGDQTGGNDLSIYRGDTGELVANWPVWRPGRIQAFTPDDAALLVANKGELDEWSIADGAVVNSYWFDTGARLLGFPRADAITISSPSDTTSWSLTQKYKVLASLPFSATTASWTADGAAAAAIASDGVLFHLWREPDGTELCSPAAPGPTAAATSFALSGDGRVLGVGKSDGLIDLFDSSTGARRAVIETAHGPIQTMQLSWDGWRAATQVARDAPVQLWSADGLTGSVSLPGRPATGYSPSPSFAISPDARTVAIGTPATSSTPAATVLMDVPTGVALPVVAAGPWVVRGAFSPDSLHLAEWVGGALATWRVADAVRDDVLIAPAEVAPSASASLPSIALASDWSLAAALNGTAMIVWDPRDGTKVSQTGGFMYGYGNTVLGIAGATVAVNQYVVHTFAADYYAAHLYDAASGVELRVFDGYDGARPLLLGTDGTHAYTLEPPDVIAWCR